MQDLQGRKYLTLDEAKVGRKVQLDGDFSCAEKDGFRELKADKNGELYFDCKAGQHYIDGQLSEQRNFYVGIYPA